MPGSIGRSVPERVERRLAAILAADVAGYSRLMGADEEGTLARSRRSGANWRSEDRRAPRPHRQDHRRRPAGEFAERRRCGALRGRGAAGNGRAQRRLSRRDSRIEFRIGINLGDVIVEGDDIFGDGVNVAARLEALAEPGGICVSEYVSRPGARQARPSPSRIWASSRSRTSPGRCGSIEFATLPPRASRRAARPQPERCRSPTSRRSRCCRSPNMSGDPEQEYFADGMVEEIITALSPHPLALRHRPQFELHLQGPSRRCEAGRARAGRALCARRLGAQSRRPGAHHRRS